MWTRSYTVKVDSRGWYESNFAQVVRIRFLWRLHSDSGLTSLVARRRVLKQRSVFVTRRHPPAASRVRGDGRPRASGRPRIDIARDLGLRARLAGHLPTSTPRARVYITRRPPPGTDTPPQITAYKANFIGTCMQYAQGAPNCASNPPGRLLWYPTRLRI